VTALKGFERLEAEATYAPDADAAPEAVLLKFGDASLTILRFDETPIDHWPLASLRRVKGGRDSLTLAPDHGAPDRLHISDRDMVAAIRAVARGLDAAPLRARPRRRRSVRIAGWTAVVAALCAGAWLLWPTALSAVAAATPPAARAALGDAAVARSLGDTLCADRAARRSLDRWGARISAARGGAPVRIVIGAFDAAAAGPGGRVILPASILEDPDEAAAAVAAALETAASRPPMAAALAAAGLAGLLELLQGAPDGPALTAAAAAALAPAGAAAGAAAVQATPAEWAVIRKGCAG
jgi:hypothetical protein